MSWNEKEGTWLWGTSLGPRRWMGWEDRCGRHAHPTHPLELNEERRRVSVLRNASVEVGFVHHNDGPELEVVPWPTYEEPWSILGANVTPKRAQAVSRPFYKGEDGDELALQPSHHRKRWTESQWLAFHEYVAERARVQKADKAVFATQWVVKRSRRHKPKPKQKAPRLLSSFEAMRPEPFVGVEVAPVESGALTGLAFIRAEQRRLEEAYRERDEARMLADAEKAQLELTRKRAAWLRTMRKVRDET